jgi:hypothetical protein
MSMKDDLADLEASNPGLTQRIWEEQGRGYTPEHDASCAAAVKTFARLCGKAIEITPETWATHRQSMGIRAYVKQQKSIEMPLLQAELAAEIAALRQTIDRQIYITERLVTVLETWYESRRPAATVQEENGQVLDRLA